LRHIESTAAKQLFSRATGFVAVSEALRDQLQTDLCIPETRIGVFPNGIDPGQFHRRNPHAMRRKHALPQNEFLVIFVGAFDERKGALRVSQALEGLPDVRGIFVGDGPLRPTGGQVAFCGRALHQDVAELLSAADLFVLPSREEGCSNATLEAMASGLPIVVSRRPFNAEICDEGCACFVEPDDIGEIRQAVMALRDDPDRRRRLGDAAFARSTRFDIRDRARRILAWMEQKIPAPIATGGESVGSAPATPRAVASGETN
jgi:glycosyltransferase involved in cell wall biosynthesis